MYFLTEFFNVLKRRINNSSNTQTHTVVIEFEKRPNAIDSNAELFFTARKMVKLGMAKDAIVMEDTLIISSGIALNPYGIRFVEVRHENVRELLRYSRSMGASRWRLSA